MSAPLRALACWVTAGSEVSDAGSAQPSPFCRPGRLPPALGRSHVSRARAAVAAMAVLSRPPSPPNLLTPPPLHMSGIEEAPMRKGLRHRPGEPKTDRRPGQGPPQGQGRRPASSLRPAGRYARLLPQAGMTDGPRRKGHCLGSSGSVLGGGGRGGAPSERSLGPCLAFGSPDLDSNWTLFWLLRMGRFRS